jgi:hypothetical protein
VKAAYPYKRFLLLFTLDIGKSFIFHVDEEERKRVAEEIAQKRKLSSKEIPKRDVIAYAWKAMFPEKELVGRNRRYGWDLRPLPKFASPRGPLTRLRLDPSQVDLQLKRLPYITIERLEALFFPLGTGVLVVTAYMSGEAEDVLDDFFRKKDSLRMAMAPGIRAIERRFETVLMIGANKLDYIKELRDVRREPSRGPAHAFPIVFIAAEKDYGELKKRHNGYVGMGEALDEDESVAVDYRYFYKKSLYANVFIGWTEAYILDPKGDRSAENAIKNVFIIGITSWYSLRVMERISSAYLLSVYKRLASKNTEIIKAKSRVMRLTFMDAANASHPVRWTGLPQELGLLEKIQEAWNSLHLWDIVEEKTNTLATYHSQLEDEELETKNRRLTQFGIIIACVTLVSAIADIKQILPDTCALDGIKANLWQLAVALPLVIALGAGSIWTHKRWKNRKRERKERKEYQRAIKELSSLPS